MYMWFTIYDQYYKRKKQTGELAPQLMKNPKLDFK